MKNLRAPALAAGFLLCCVASGSALVPSSSMELNGTAIRTVWGFEVYRASLFLPSPSSNPSEILSDRSAPKKLELAVLRHIPSDKFVSAVSKSVDDNFSESEKAKFASDLAEFLGCFKSPSGLARGTVVTLEFDPTNGMSVLKEGSRVASFASAEFYHAILRLWLGNPPQESVKRGLLGIES